MDSRQTQKTDGQSTKRESYLICKLFLIQNHEMIQKAEQLRNQYYILKMTPRPKMNDILKNVDIKEFMRKME